MDVGVISDTHLSAKIERGAVSCLETKKPVNDLEFFYKMIKPYFQGVEVILHAGDIVDLSVIEVLEQFGSVYAVSGNMDPAPVRKSLPEKRIVELNGFRIGLIHGWGYPEGLAGKVQQKFTGEKVDCIVFGHSHHPYDRVENGVLMFNPGSPTDKRFATSRNVGILHLEDEIYGEHISID